MNDPIALIYAYRELSYHICGDEVALCLVCSTPARSSSLDSSPERGLCCVLGKTLYSHSVSLDPNVDDCTSKFDGGRLRWTRMLSREGGGG